MTEQSSGEFDPLEGTSQGEGGSSLRDRKVDLGPDGAAAVRKKGQLHNNGYVTENDHGDDDPSRHRLNINKEALNQYIQANQPGKEMNPIGATEKLSKIATEEEKETPEVIFKRYISKGKRLRLIDGMDPDLQIAIMLKTLNGMRNEVSSFEFTRLGHEIRGLKNKK